MKRGSISLRSSASLVLFVAASICGATYQRAVILKHPFASEHTDPYGNPVTDSLVRFKTFKATLYRSDMTDSVTVEDKTNDSGLCMLHFDQWPKSSTSIELASIQRLDLSFPNTWRATRTGSRFHFEPLRIEQVSVTGRTGETLVIVIPLSVTMHEYNIGHGYYAYDFAVLADCHIGEGSKATNGMEDFGTELWNDADNDPNESTFSITNVEACRDFIDSLYEQAGYDIRFVAVAGDISSTSERSEYERARQVFAGFNSDLFVVPMMGNHDAWPYVGTGPWPLYNFDEEGSGSVVIGEYFTEAFGGAYDTLHYIMPAANWQQSSFLLTPTDSSCEEWPSYYNDFAFNYQGCKFIATDFAPRVDALPNYPGVPGPPDTYWGESYHWTMDWLGDQIDSVPEGERIISLGHYAYYKPGWPYSYGNFNDEELQDISDQGLTNNKPIAFSIGGHMHPYGDDIGRTRYGADTICDYYAVNAAKDGNFYIFHVLDAVRLEVSHEWGSPPSRTVEFNATYSHQGSENASEENRWDYGDGSGFEYGQLEAEHEYDDVERDTTYKVSLRITTVSGRHVWVCDTVHVSPIHDVMCAAIDTPPDTVHWGTVMTPSARTYNNGPYTESYSVRMRIVNESDSVVYDTIASVSGHAPQDTEVVTFPTWHADEHGDYAVSCSTELAYDGVPSNNKSTATCTVLYPYDVSADSIISSQRVGYYEQLNPSGVVANHYDDEVTFWVKFVIDTAYVDSQQVVSMSESSSQVVEFAPVSQLEPGVHDMKLIVRLTDDECPANDTFSVQLLVVDSDYWLSLAALPWNHDAVLVEGPDADSTVYVAQRDGSGLAKYSIPLDLWNVGTIPASSMLSAQYSADRYGNYIFVLGNYSTRKAIARYTVSANQWDTVTTNLPSGVAENGGVFARRSDTLYVLLRNTGQSFWRYVVPTRSWTWLQDPPLGSYGTAATAYDGGNLIHVLQVNQNSHGTLQTYSISGMQWQQSQSIEDDLLSGSGTAITTVSGRSSAFALWPTSYVDPGLSANFDEYAISGDTWMPCWPYFDTIGPHPSMASRDGLPYATCGITGVTAHTFGRYYPAALTLGREGVCANPDNLVTEHGLSSAPNPFKRGTTIHWQVPKATRAFVAVYDVQGRLVKKLHDGELEPGRYSQVWYTKGTPAGVYLCTFATSERRMAQRLILMK